MQDEKIYQGNSIEICLKEASEIMGVPIEDLKYEIVEKKGFIRKTFSIKVYNLVTKKDGLNGVALVENGKIIIKNPKEGGKPCKILSGEGIKLSINGNQMQSGEVYEDAEVSVFIEDKNSERKMHIDVSEDNMEAFLSINYVPKVKYKLKDTLGIEVLNLELEQIEEEYPPLFTREEVINYLKSNNITYGINEMDLNEALKQRCVDKKIIAKGQKVIESIDDEVKMEFQSLIGRTNSDDLEKIDFREVVHIEVVKPGQVLLTKIEGQEGQEGIDLSGKKVRAKKAKKINLRVGDGCSIEGNTIVANIEGNPSYVNNVVTVHKVHNVNGDVDLSTGNIDFIGEVMISGSITSGMKVVAGSGALVQGNMDNSRLIAKGETFINGNVITSKIEVGAFDSSKQSFAESLNMLYKNVKDLIDTVEEVKKQNLLGYNKSDGEIIKVLIENKYKLIPKICMEIIKYNAMNGGSEDSIVKEIKNKLIGLAPINIKYFTELNDILNIVEKKNEELADKYSIPVTLTVNYVQESKIYSSGDIVFTGKGAYISEVISKDKVIFKTSGAIVRSGSIKAENEIRAKMVGSAAGVKTILEVGKKGHIWVDTAYINTKFIVGEREMILEESSRNIHVYLDGKGDLIIEKLKL